MNNPVFVVDVRAETFTPGNPAAAQLSSDWPPAAQGWPLTLLFADGDPSAAADDHARWLRLPSGRRLWTGALNLPLPDDAGRALLNLRAATDGELDATACQTLAALLAEYRNGGTTLRVLGEICELLTQSLGLALVRALRLDDGALTECVSRGDAHVAAAARQLPEQIGAADGCGAAALANGKPGPIKLDAPANGGWKHALHQCGVRSVLARRLDGLDEVFVLELFAYGADDLTDAPAAAFLDRWIAWLGQQFAVRRLQQEQQLLADALQSASTAAFITDAEGTFVWINPAFTACYGYTPQDVIGRATPRILQSGKHGALYYDRLWATLSAGHAWSSETVDRTADQRLITVRQNITPVRHNGRITHFLATHADLTAEAQLAAIADLQQGTDVVTGILTQAAFEERCRQLLTSASAERQTPGLLLMGVQTRSGGIPRLDAETLAFARAALGERIRSVIGEDIIGGTLAGFDFAFLLPHPGRVEPKLERELAELLSAPLPLLGETLELCCQFGEAHYPADGADFDALRRSAERRMLAATGPARAVLVRSATPSEPLLPPPR